MRIKGIYLGLGIFWFIVFAYYMHTSQSLIWLLVSSILGITDMYFAFPEDKETKKK